MITVQQGDKRYRPLFYLFPADIMLVLVILLAVYLIWALYRELKEYRNVLSPWSVHEAVNNVPCGVCISDPLGRIILCNIKMQELSRVLIGNCLQNYSYAAQRAEGRFCEEAGPEIKLGQ